MKISITIGEVVQAHSALTNIGGNASVDMAWAIDDIKLALEKHSKRFQEQRLKLLDHYGEKNAQSNYTVKNSNMSSFTEALDKISGIEVDIEFEPLDYDIILAQDVKIPIALAKALRRFIVKQKVEKVPEVVVEKPIRKVQAHKEPTPVEEPAGKKS